ncbi:MAG: DUF2284 domain-containing protein [Thermoplasmata archaeon]
MTITENDGCGHPMTHEEEALGELLSAAKKLGSSDVKVIPASQVVVDKRVRLKCSVPRCSNYGQHLLCPPNVMSVDEFAEILRLYERAIIVQIEANVDSLDRADRPLDMDLCKELEESTPARTWGLKLHRLINALETEAFKNGFYLAAGLIGNDCELCPECVRPGFDEPCRHPFEARPSMQAMGIDVWRTCKNAGLRLSFSSKDKVRWTGLVLLD